MCLGTWVRQLKDACKLVDCMRICTKSHGAREHREWSRMSPDFKSVIVEAFTYKRTISLLHCKYFKRVFIAHLLVYSRSVWFANGMKFLKRDDIQKEEI